MSTRWSPRDIATGVVSTFIATAIYAAVSVFTQPDPKPVERFGLILGIVVVMVLVGLPLARRIVDGPVLRYVRPRIENEIRGEALHDFQIDLESKTGIETVYDSFAKCEDEIKEHVETSKRIDIFVQIGKTVLSGGNDFYDYLQSAKMRDEARVRILHADGASAYLTERVARERGSDLAAWRDDLRNSAKKAATLRTNAELRVEARQHQEGYIWRIFVFDDQAYVQPYLFPRNNSSSAPVLKFSRLLEEKGNPRSIYGAFSKYFEIVWDECAPQSSSLARLVGNQADGDAQISVAAIIEKNGLYTFVVPRRYIDRGDRDVPFHCIGGKPHPGEGFVGALLREAREEVGVDLEFQSVTGGTRYITTSSERKRIELSDVPKPLMVYKRSRNRDPHMDDPNVQWLVGYRCDITPGQPPKPGAEVGAVVVLSGAALAKALDGNVTFDEIAQMGDGSFIERAKDVQVDPGRVLEPTGLAAVLATDVAGTA